jgi:general secretion pathway protein A
MDLLAYWNLKERPFEATWDAGFYFQGPDHEEALERLHFLVAEQSMHLGLLTGEIGSGKTLLRAVFMDQLDPDRHVVVAQENSSFNFNDLLGSVLRHLGAEPPGVNPSKIMRYEQFRTVAEEIHAAAQHLVLIFDEAQEMATATLNDFKLLLNLNGDGQNLLTLILIGQPELRQRILRVPSMNQRVSLRYHLPALSVGQTALYLQQRLCRAGHPDGDLFTEDAIARAYDVSGGIPRELNRLAKLALDVAFLKAWPRVNRAAIDAVVRDLERFQPLHAA